MNRLRGVAGAVMLAALALLLASCAPAVRSAVVPLPAPAGRQADTVDIFLGSFEGALDRLAGDGAADIPATITYISGLIHAGPAPDAEGRMPVFTRAQRLKMDALAARMADMQAALAENLAAAALPGGTPGGSLAAEAFPGDKAGRYDQLIERFGRELDAWEKAIKEKRRADSAAIGVLLEPEARALIPVGTNGSAAQRIRAVSLSGRYAELAARAAALR